MIRQSSSVLTVSKGQAGSRLRRTRKSLGLSLRSVASRAGLDPAHLSRLERGEAHLTVDTLYRLACALELDELARHIEPFISPKGAVANERGHS